MLNSILDKIIKDSLFEDIGTGDVTTLACIPQDKRVHGYFLMKSSGTVCGMPVVRRVFELLDPEISVVSKIPEGGRAEKTQILAEIEGPARSILTGERTALNFLCHLSGIATLTADAVVRVKGKKAEITDTRKTIPGMRLLEKYAVRTGGGRNHRFGLSDGCLIKDNHIVAAGGILQAVKAVKKNAPHTLRIEVETCNFAQVMEALKAGADLILLDNMTMEQMEQSVKIVDGRVPVEASGNMGEKDLTAVAGTGVDFISIGALTHSACSLDISLKLDNM